MILPHHNHKRILLMDWFILWKMYHRESDEEKNQSRITKKDLSLISRSTLLFSDKSKWEEIQIYSFELNFLTLNRELPAMKCSMLNKKPLFMSWWRSFFIEMNNWALCIRLIWHIGMYYINNRIFFFCSEFRCIDIMRYVVL